MYPEHSHYEEQGKQSEQQDRQISRIFHNYIPKTFSSHEGRIEDLQNAEELLTQGLQDEPERIAEKQHTLKGEASYYADAFNGRKTASGELFSNTAMTAAHKTLPLGTWVRVKSMHPTKGQLASVDVRINDRGPYIPGRVIDLTKSAFTRISPKSSTDVGAMKVSMKIISLPKIG